MVKRLILICLLALPAMAELRVMGNVTNTVWAWDGTRFIASWGSAEPTITYNPSTDFNYTTNAGAITITLYKGPSGEVNVPPTINGHPVTVLGANSFFFNANPTGLRLPDSVTTIMENAVNTCANLHFVICGSGLTALDDYAICWMTDLDAIYFTGNAPATLFENSIRWNQKDGGAYSSSVVYRRSGATGWPTVPGTFGNLATAIWTSYPNPMP